MTGLPWQASLVERLARRVAEGAVPHALLLTGPEGWGERALANWLALALLGLDEAADASAIAHPDLRWLEPEEGSIRVDAIRELVGFAQGTAQSGTRKVAVVADAHTVNVHAANALLKTLEEPPAGTHLLLFSAHPARLLPTIRSRCQLVALRPDSSQARRWLEQQGAGENLERCLFEHGDAPVAALEALERGEASLEPLLTQALTGDSGVTAAQALLADDLPAVLGRWYRYVLAWAAGRWEPPGLAGAAPRAVMAFADELIWVRRVLLTSSGANQRLLAERLVARWRYLRPSTRR